jgi:hypothetical protein
MDNFAAELAAVATARAGLVDAQAAYDGAFLALKNKLLSTVSMQSTIIDAINGVKDEVTDLASVVANLASAPPPTPDTTPAQRGDGQKLWTQADVPAAPDANGYYHLGDPMLPDKITITINSGQNTDAAGAFTAPIASFGLYCNETKQAICSGIQVPWRGSALQLKGGFVFHGKYPPAATFLQSPDPTLTNSYTKISVNGLSYETSTVAARGAVVPAQTQWNNKSVATLWGPVGASSSDAAGSTTGTTGMPATAANVEITHADDTVTKLSVTTDKITYLPTDKQIKFLDAAVAAVGFNLPFPVNVVSDVKTKLDFTGRRPYLDRGGICADPGEYHFRGLEICGVRTALAATTRAASGRTPQRPSPS